MKSIPFKTLIYLLLFFMTVTMQCFSTANRRLLKKHSVRMDSDSVTITVSTNYDLWGAKLWIEYGKLPDCNKKSLPQLKKGYPGKYNFNIIDLKPSTKYYFQICGHRRIPRAGNEKISGHFITKNAVVSEPVLKKSEINNKIKVIAGITSIHQKYKKKCKKEKKLGNDNSILGDMVEPVEKKDIIGIWKIDFNSMKMLVAGGAAEFQDDFRSNPDLELLYQLAQNSTIIIDEKKMVVKILAQKNRITPYEYYRDEKKASYLKITSEKDYIALIGMKDSSLWIVPENVNRAMILIKKKK